MELRERTLNGGNVLRLRSMNASVLRAVEHNCRRNHRHWVSQGSQFILTVSVAAIFTEFTDSCFHKVATDLSFVIG